MSKGMFVSLHNHTELGSPQDGMNDIDELFDRAKSIDHPAIAITDHGTLTAHYDAWKASKRTGVSLIPGGEFYFTEDLSTKKNRHMVLLPKNANGYKNILRLNYESYRPENCSHGFMGKLTPRISWDHLEEYGSDIFCLTACSNGLIAKTLITEGNEQEAICHLKRLKSIFGDRFFLEIQPHQLKAESKAGPIDQVGLNEAMIKYSREYDIPIVATCDAHYLDKDSAKYHDLMLAIKDKAALDDPDRFRYGTQEMYLKTHEQIIDFFGDKIGQEAMANSIRIANACEPATYLESSGPILQTFPVRNQNDYNEFLQWNTQAKLDIPEDQAYLRYRCVMGFKEQLSGLDPEQKQIYWDRVKKELSVIEYHKFSSYMLMVSDYVNWAKNNGITVGPGRGSGAGSLIAKLTKITSVDPIKYGLLFERFHNKEKSSFPDIDTDFSEPERVKEYLKQKYGEDHVASISNMSVATPKVIIKDVARTLRIGGDKTTAFQLSNHITENMPDTDTIEEAVEQSKEFAAYMREYPDLYQNALKLQNLTRQWGVHAAGVIVGDRPLYEIIPLRFDDSGAVVAQWDKDRCEEFGLVKFDILGVKTLEVISNTLRNIDAIHNIKMTQDDIPLDDKATYDMISCGDTSGVFQLEASLTPLCMKIKPDNVESISDINALGRPAVSANERTTYIERRFGRREVEYTHPKLSSALSKTYGISLYEEGLMSLAKDCAGWDLNEADSLRKITKLKGKKPELVRKSRASFIKGCIEYSGMTAAEAEEIWEKEVEGFQGYGFNKSHAVAYSFISVWTAWLRRHYPTEYMCALLNRQNPNDDKVQTYLSECKRMGIKILPPDINRSDSQYIITEPSTILSGMGTMKGVGEKALNELQNNKPFKNMADFFAKVDGRVIQKTVIQALAGAGALDSLGRTRKDWYENFEKYRTKVNNAYSKAEDSIILPYVEDKYPEFKTIKKKADRTEFISKIDLSTISDNIKAAIIQTISSIEFPEYNEEWDNKEKLLAEKKVLGRTISGSIHEVYRGYFNEQSRSVTPLSRIIQLPANSKIRVEAIVQSKMKEFKAKKGKNAGMKFAKYIIEDVYGTTSEMTVWPEQYAKFRDHLDDGVPFKAICKVNEYMEKKELSLDRLENVFGKSI